MTLGIKCAEDKKKQKQKKRAANETRKEGLQIYTDMTYPARLVPITSGFARPSHMHM